MNQKLFFCFLWITMCLTNHVKAQNVSLYQQFAGRYDFTFTGNTLNPDENNSYYPSFIYTSSSANLTLQPTDMVEAAYLYWAGCGNGDFDIKLNDIDITAERTFSTTQASSGKVFFSAFYDITDIVATQGSTSYTVSELDINDQIALYWNNGTHFAGWAILVVYRNDALPLNVVNVYDGLESLSTTPLGEVGELNITINDLNVIDDVGSKIGFIAWEGDRGIPAPGSDIIESLSINGIIVGDPPLNPDNNAFNGTNSVTGAENLYNMDLDIYNIQNFIAIGDDTATIQLATGQDYVMINAIVTKLNSQLPDATVSIDNYSLECYSRQIPIEYTVYNLNSTDPLPAGTQVGIYADNELIATNQTPITLQIGESIILSQIVTIPASIPDDFTLRVTADYDTEVTELIETNNSATQPISLWVSPVFNQPEDIVNCNLGLTSAYFDFSAYEQNIPIDSSHLISFHENLVDAETNSAPIINTMNYYAEITPKEIFVRIEDENGCVSITSFFLRTRNCPPTIYNAVSANGDGLNDTFHIDGLYNIFVNFELLVYNRWGRLVWTGNNNKEEWNGYVKEGIGSANAPDGTYYYVLKLNDKDYPDALTGYLYLNH